MSLPDGVFLKIRLAIGDPGHFTPRANHHQEALTVWQTRAVEIVLQEAGLIPTGEEPNLGRVVLQEVVYEQPQLTDQQKADLHASAQGAWPREEPEP